MDTLPCASLLLRIYQAPKSEDGIKVLSREDVPKKDWEKKGVWVVAPHYGLGKYNNVFCHIRETENELFYLRMRREDPPLRTTATILMNSVGITHDIVIFNSLKC